MQTPFVRKGNLGITRITAEKDILKVKLLDLQGGYPKKTLILLVRLISHTYMNVWESEEPLLCVKQQHPIHLNIFHGIF